MDNEPTMGNGKISEKNYAGIYKKVFGKHRC